MLENKLIITHSQTLSSFFAVILEAFSFTESTSSVVYPILICGNIPADLNLLTITCNQLYSCVLLYNC